MTATTPEAPTTVVVEQQPAPAPAAAPAAAVPGMVPGVPLLVAGANVAGGVAAAALSVAGPAGLAVAGTTAVVVAAGTAASRIVRRARSRSGKGTTAAALRTARRTPAASGSSGSPSRGSSSPTRRIGSVPSPRGTGSSTARSARPSASSLRSTASRLTPGRTGSPAAAPRPGQSSPGGGKHRAPHASRSSSSPSVARRAAAGLARAAVGTPARQAKREQRREQRITRGVERARRSAGLDPKTGQPLPARKGDKGALTIRQGKALRRSTLRHAARTTAAGLAAGVAGLASLVFNPKRPGRAWATAARVWARLSGSSRSARARRDAAIRGEQLPGCTAVPADTVTDPTRPDTPPAAPVQPTQPARPQRIGATTEGDTTVSDTAAPFARLSTAAETMLQAASTFDPEVMAEFQAMIDDLPDAMRTVQETLRVLAELSAERLPVDPAVVEEMAEGFRAMDRVVHALEEVPATYRRVHAEDLERHESPRNGLEAERKWNV